MMVRQILEPEALERLNRIGLVKPEKQHQIEMMIIDRAQSGNMTEKMSEQTLIKILDQVDPPESKPKVVISRRKGCMDDEDDFDFDNM